MDTSENFHHMNKQKRGNGVLLTNTVGVVEKRRRTINQHRKGRHGDKIINDL
jgi:hypothetical protein